MNEEQKADPFTRRKTLPQLVSMVRFMLTERKANFIKIAATLEKMNPCHSVGNTSRAIICLV